MARILDAETEAFAPTVTPVERVKARTMDDDLRRLGLVAGVAKEALPLADFAARGGSTLYGGIKDWFAERDQEQKAEAAKVRRAKKFEDDFAATETKPQPGPTAAVAGGASATVPSAQEIAKDRLANLQEQYASMSPEEQERFSRESNRMLKQKYAEEQTKAQKLQAEKFYGEHPEFAEQVKSETLPQAAQALGRRDVELAQQQAISEHKQDIPRSTERVADWHAAQEAQRERDYITKLAKQLPPEGTVVSPEREQEIMGEVAGDWFQPDHEFGKAELEAPKRDSLNLRRIKLRAGAMNLNLPEANSDKIAQKERLRLPTTTYTEERGGIPAGAMTAGTKPVPHPFEQGVVPELVKPEPRMTLDQIDERVRRDAQAKAAAAEPEAAKPTGPLTIGTATESQLKMVKSRLEAAARAKPDDQELAGRLKDISDELEYRQTKDIPRTYEQWAARARLADTPEEQARVLEWAKNIHMPVGGLADLLTPSSQLAERQALGTREERGLFPELSRRTESQQMKDRAEAALLIGRLRGLDMKDPAQAAQAWALSELYLAGAGLKTEQAKTEAGLREPKVVKTQEEAALIHKRESLMDAQIGELGSREALNRARAIRAKMAGVRGGGAGPSKEDRKWFDSMSRVAKELTADAAQAENLATQQLNAQILETRRAEERFQATAGALKETPETIVPGYDDAAEIRRKEEKNRRIAQAQANKEAFEASRSLEQKLSVERQVAEDRRKKADERAEPFREAAEKFAIPAARRAGYGGPLLPQKKTEGGVLGRLARVAGGKATAASASEPKKKDAKTLLDELKK